MQTSLTLGPSEIAQRRVVLTRATVLNEVKISATPPGRLAEFNEARKLGIGVFYEREWLATQEGNTLSAVMLQTPGVWIWNAQDGTRRASVASNRKCIPAAVFPQAPRDSRMVPGSPAGPGYLTCSPCFAQVWMDGHQMSRTGDTPFDINTIPVGEIEALEYYRSSSEVPMKYKGVNGGSCGVVVIHTIFERGRPPKTRPQ
jgi:hypothetical protein